MLIQKIVPYNEISEFWAYSLLLAGPGYFPFIRGYKFNFTEEFGIGLESLRAMLPDCNQGCLLTGSFNEISRAQLQEKLYGPLSWKVDYAGNLTQSSDELLIQNRFFVFLDILRVSNRRECIERIFFYTPGDGDFFAETTMWHFCFVALINGKLVLVYGKTWPSWAACKPDNDYEEDWRGWHKLL